MSEPKVQLIDPQGNINLPGINATGVITATSFDGAGGVVTGLTGNPNLNVGVVTATSFVGDGTGHAAGLTGTPNLNLGVTTSTGFIGDAVGKAAGLTGTPNLNVGLITATGFAGDVKGAVTGNITGNVTGNITGDVTGNITGDVTGNITGNIGGDVEGDVTGNVSGLARGLGISANGVWAGAGTSNVNVGVITAIQYHGDGSGLTGAGSSASIAQEITATSGETIIDLSYGNLIYYKGDAHTTVGFASTSAAEQITFIRDGNPNYSISYSTGGVDFDGDDTLTLAASSDFTFDGDFTVEGWFYVDSHSNYDALWGLGRYSGASPNDGVLFYFVSDGILKFYAFGGDLITGPQIALNAWSHVAIVRSGSTVTMYVNGNAEGSATKSDDFGSGSNNTFNIGSGLNSSSTNVDFFDGKISNFRVVKGTAVYTTNFVPPRAALTNISGTKLLCCQSDSSATTAAVTPGTITAVGDPTAGAQTISTIGSLNATITWPDRVKWNGGAEPALSATPVNNVQIFRLTTVDTGLTYNGWEEIDLDPVLKLFTWGQQQRGQMGINEGTSYKTSSPVQLPSGTNTATWSKLFTVGPPSSGDRGIRSVIKTDGTLWSMGYNSRGDLGLNDRTARSSPTQVPGTTWASGNIGGESYCNTIAIKTDNTMWTWGQNEDGSLGLNQAHDLKISSPTQIGTDATWSTVRGGSSVVAATKTDGTFWTWGANKNGVLGKNVSNTPSNRGRSSPVQVPGTWSNNFTVTHGASILAVKPNGTLWSWGYNSDGQLGLNQKSSPTTRARSSPCQIGTDTTWGGSKIGANGFASFGIVKTDGTLWTWGRQASGQNMQNSTIARSSPTQIPGTNWAYYSASYRSAFGGKTDGTLWVCGQNYNGQFGIPSYANNTSVSSPIQLHGSDWDGTSATKLTTDAETQMCFRTPLS